MSGKIIIIEGIIGAGKTTLVNDLYNTISKYNDKIIIQLEEVNKEYLNLYISDMKKYAFSFQTYIMRERMNTLDKAKLFRDTGYLVIIDRGLLGDLAFTNMQYKKGYITSNEYKAYISLYNENIIVPDEILYLNIDPEEAMERIKKRSNQSEIDGYSIKYLKDLKNEYELLLNDKVKVINKDSKIELI